MIVIGIDPGLTGAVAFVDHNGLRAVHDLPTMPIVGVGPAATVQREIDPVALRDLLRAGVPADEEAIAVVEHAPAMGVSRGDGPQRGMQAQVSLAATKATIGAVLHLAFIPVRRVAPQTWKRFYGLGAEKKRGLELARQFYPCDDIRLVKHHNRAEAALIARYGLKLFA
ncbi:RuvC family protein [Burkholderia cenocepacia]|uniref:hypothetical protein n=1 Tax=Burkholderia cenocepacia TaxID=95486 RepID=UPI0022379A7E|nr:hypothetical protein [Burkholderia cenocepacia]MCW5141074.1 hypothetical protein [Burkholderia cenocepacia]